MLGQPRKGDEVARTNDGAEELEMDKYAFVGSEMGPSPKAKRCRRRGRYLAQGGVGEPDHILVDQILVETQLLLKK